jgi:hypothetical protein
MTKKVDDNVVFIGQAAGGPDDMFERLKVALQPDAVLIVGNRYKTDGAVFGVISKGMSVRDLSFLKEYTVRLLDSAIEDLLYASIKDGEDEDPDDAS